MHVWNADQFKSFKQPFSNPIHTPDPLQDEILAVVKTQFFSGVFCVRGRGFLILLCSRKVQTLNKLRLLCAPSRQLKTGLSVNKELTLSAQLPCMLPHQPPS